MIQIAAVALPGTFMSSIASLLDSFWLASERRRRLVRDENSEETDLALTLLSVDGRDVVLNSYSTLRIDRPIASSDRFDFIWLPSFRAGGEEMLRDKLANNGELINWLGRSAARGSMIGASGAAVVFPLAAHLADGLSVPVAPALAPVIRALFPRFRHADIAMADHGRLLLSRGVGQDLSTVAAALTRLLSPETGRWLRSVSGTEFAEDESTEGLDPLVDAARLRLEQRFTTAVSLAELATELCVSHAVLIRHFRKVLGMTPSAYVQRLRLAAAQRMLARSNRSIDSIAAAVGYSDARIFRQMFRRATGWNATMWRAENQHRF